MDEDIKELVKILYKNLEQLEIQMQNLTGRRIMTLEERIQKLEEAFGFGQPTLEILQRQTEILKRENEKERGKLIVAQQEVNEVHKKMLSAVTSLTITTETLEKGLARS